MNRIVLADVKGSSYRSFQTPRRMCGERLEKALDQMRTASKAASRGGKNAL